jgi:endoglucanase
MNANKFPLIRFAVFGLIIGLAGSAGALEYSGVNLAGAEFGESHLPGTYNSDYTYPTQSEVDYFKSRGMNIIRFCFRWERLQHTNHSAFDATEFNNRFHPFVSQTTAKGVYVILDPHNYARYYGSLVGSATVPNSDFADFWSRLASIYQTNDHVIFGLINEPNTMPTEQWVSAANDAITAIRATGATNLILVPGNAWTGAWTWSQNWYGTPNAQAMLNIVDSGDNFAFDVHQYLDTNGSGSSTNIDNNDPMTGANRLAGFTQWCKDNNRRGFLGEFAVGTNTIGANIGDEAISNMLSHIETNADVWLGWTWWAAGPWWGGYMFTLEPKAGNTDTPPMTVLTNFIVIPPPTLQVVNGTQFKFGTWPRFTFQAEASPDLAIGVWTNYGSAIISNGNPASVTMPVGADPAAFYRVRAHRLP